MGLYQWCPTIDYDYSNGINNKDCTNQNHQKNLLVMKIYTESLHYNFFLSIFAPHFSGSRKCEKVVEIAQENFTPNICMM